MTGVPIVSFFTGGGFLDLGFEKAGFNTVWSNEFNNDIADMYEHGMSAYHLSKNPEAPLVRVSSRKSIDDVSPAEIKKCLPKNGFFGVTGGPPCPDFSVGGKNRGRHGDRGRLSQSYVNMICALKPAFFLMENVPGLLRTQKHREFFDELCGQLRRAGYVIDFTILNALWVGVPQDRRRVFVVGFLPDSFKGAMRKKIISDKNRGTSWFPFPLGEYRNALDLPWPEESKFGSKPAKPSGIPLELTVYPILKGTAGFSTPSTAPNGHEGFTPYSKKFLEVAEGDVSRKSYKRLHRYRYSPTACYGNNEVHLHPWEPRRLTVREALRIQTVPDEYVLPEDKPLTVKYKMIGNGVPCKLAHAVAKAMASYLEM